VLKTAPDRTGNAGAPAGSDGKGGEARLRVLRSGFRYSGTRPEIDRPLVLLGQHTDAILAELGYDAARIAALRETKAVG